jgi:hypothetical protein
MSVQIATMDFDDVPGAPAERMPRAARAHGWGAVFARLTRKLPRPAPGDCRRTW